MLSKNDFKDYFIKIDAKRTINLKHVTNISFDYSKDKIIFAMDYGIQADNERPKDSDTHKIDRKVITGYISAYGIQELIQQLKTKKYFNNKFIEKRDSGDSYKGWINLDQVTSLKREDNNLKLIVNFSNSVTYYDFKKGNCLVSEFLYLYFSDEKDYNDYIEYIEKKLDI